MKKTIKFSANCLLCGNDNAKKENIIPGIGYTCDFCSKLKTKEVIAHINMDKTGFRNRLVLSVGHGRFEKMAKKFNSWVEKRERKRKD